MEMLCDSTNGRFIYAICIGSEYSRDYKKYILPNWIKYCQKFDIGLIVFFNELIDQESEFYKKPTWQRYIAPEKIISNFTHIKTLCYLDTDILISPLAPNIFEFHKRGSVSVISEIHNLPFSLDFARRSLAYNRHKFYSEAYPLDSALFMTPQDIFEHHGFNSTETDEYFCSGVFVFDVDCYAQKMSEWFYTYPDTVDSITGGGDEPFFNFHVQTEAHTNILDYRFQALWSYEMAVKYPYLYKFKDKYDDLIYISIKACLFSNFFLHFAGSWFEGQMWKLRPISFEEEELSIQEFESYLNVTLTGEPVGLIKPKTVDGL